jgi:hypothetical protein
MESIVVSPKTTDEARLIKELLNKMNISSKVITEEEKEDLGLLIMIKEVDRNDTVPRDEIMNKLSS